MKNLWLALGCMCLINFVPSAYAKEVHREHKAHVHGAVKIDIAFEKAEGEIVFDGAADSIIGFEHVAKTAADKKVQKDAFEKFEKNVAQIFQFDASLGCIFKTVKMEVDAEDQHSDVEAKFAVVCKNSPEGTTLRFNIAEVFPKVRKAEVQFISENVQRSLSIQSFPTSLKIQ